MLSWLATSRVPLAFMTMTRQLPLRTFQVSVCSPAPLACATQKCWAAGSVLGAPPEWTRKSELCAPRSLACGVGDVREVAGRSVGGCDPDEHGLAAERVDANRAEQFARDPPLGCGCAAVAV